MSSASVVVFVVWIALGQASDPASTASSDREVTNSIGIKLVLIPAGEFLMGSPQREFANRNGEQPQHRVGITTPFWLGQYEVTQAEYSQVMGANPSGFSSGGECKDKVEGLDTSRFPVENVTWEDAVEFCRKLSAVAAENSVGRVYRLPTEAEWEYACRAGTTTPFHFGNQLNGVQGNCDGNDGYGTDAKGPFLRRPTPVGSFPANSWGLFDTHGNILEWCADWFEGSYYAQSPAKDPRGPAEGTMRVRRGGSWYAPASLCRAATRDRAVPAYRNDDLGFRVAAVIEGK